jgi:hypothetical protein
MTTPLARRMWTRYEPLHAVAYFAPAPRERFEQAGVRGFWRTYFAGRAAPLGRTGPHAVHAAFQSFTFEMVHRAVPAVWELIAPADAWRTRIEGCGEALRSVTVGVDLRELVSVAATLRSVVERLDPVGRPFFAAHLDLDRPDDAHLSLWHSCTLLREHRGDGYVATCLAHDMSGLDMLLLAERSGAVPHGHAATNRGWSREAIAERIEALTAQGLLDAQGGLTDLARARRAAIEAGTDRLADAPWQALAAADVRRIEHVLTTAAGEVAGRGWITYPNPVGVEPPT